MTPHLAYLGSPTHWFILFAVALIVFGAKKLPEIARNLGKGMGEFKKARREFENELKKAEKELENASSSEEKKDDADKSA